MLYKNIHDGMLWNESEATGGEASGDDAGGKYEPSTIEDAQKIIGALTKRLEERDAKIAKLAERFDEADARMKAMEQAQRQRLEESGNYAEIAKRYQTELESLKPVAERAQSLEAIIRESNETRLAGIPETYRNLVPTDYAPEKLQAWLNANEPLLKRTPPPSLDAGAGANTPPSDSVRLTAEQKATAKKFGLTDEEYAAQMRRNSQ
jgi:phage I-like protein